MTPEQQQRLSAARAARLASASTPSPAAPAPSVAPAPAVAPFIAPGLAADGKPIPPGMVRNPNFDPNAQVPLDALGQPIPPGMVRNPNFGQPREFDPDDPLGQVQTRPAGGKAAPWKVRVVSAPGVEPTKPQPMGARPMAMSRGGITAREGSITQIGQGGQPTGGGLFRVVEPQQRTAPFRVTHGTIAQGGVGTRVSQGEVAPMTGSVVATRPAAVAPTVVPGAPTMAPTVAPMTTVARAGTGAVPQLPLSPDSPLTLVLSAHARPQRTRQQIKILSEATLPLFDVVCWANPSRFPFDQPALDTLPNVIKPKRDEGAFRRFVEAALATTPYVAVLDDDCMPAPTWLEAAVSRLYDLEEQGIVAVIAAGGLRYAGDDAQSGMVVGPEAPPAEETEVDIGRGGWVCSTDVMRAFLTMQPLVPRAGWATHLAFVVQSMGGSTLVLPYDSGKTNWGMLQAPARENSVSIMLDLAAQQNEGPSAAMVTEAVYRAYRAHGWGPLCVQDSLAEESQIAENEAAREQGVASGDLPPGDAEEIGQEVAS